MCVEGKWVGGKLGMMDADKESFFSLIIPSIKFQYDVQESHSSNVHGHKCGIRRDLMIF